jgi:hypothetical protein
MAKKCLSTPTRGYVSLREPAAPRIKTDWIVSTKARINGTAGATENEAHAEAVQ